MDLAGQPVKLELVRWRPTPYKPKSPFQFERVEAERKQLGQSIPQGTALFDQPIMALVLNGSAAVLAAVGTAKFDGWLRALAFGVLIGAGAQTLVSGIRFLNSR